MYGSHMVSNFDSDPDPESLRGTMRSSAVMQGLWYRWLVGVSSLSVYQTLAYLLLLMPIFYTYSKVLDAVSRIVLTSMSHTQRSSIIDIYPGYTFNRADTSVLGGKGGVKSYCELHFL